MITAIRLTLVRPFFGVGPNNFAVAVHQESIEERHRVPWRTTHNTLLQVSSETGVPGLILYLATLIAAYKRIRWLRKAARYHPELEAVGSMAFVVEASLIVFMVASLFASFAYSLYFPTLTILAEFLPRLAREEYPVLRQHAVFSVASMPPARRAAASRTLPA
jgi:O-antigen ligase